MTTTPEGKVKNKAREIYKNLGIYYVPIIGGHGSRAGVPDDLLCFNSTFIGVEYKSDAKKNPTKLQTLEMQRIRKSGGMTLLVHAGNIEVLEMVLEAASGRRLVDRDKHAALLAKLLYTKEINADYTQKRFAKLEEEVK